MSMRGCVLGEAAGIGFADRLCRSSVCAISNHEEPSGEQHWSHSLTSPTQSGSTPPPPPAHRARRDATSAGLHTLPGTGIAPANRPNLRAPRASNTATQRFITESAAVDSYAAEPPEADAYAAPQPPHAYAPEAYAGEPQLDPQAEVPADAYVPEEEIAAATYQPMQPVATFPVEEPSSARMPKLALPPPPPRFSTIRRGEALLPERAHDPKYYPGLVNDPEPLPVFERKLPPWWKYAAAALGVFVAGLIARGMLAGPATWSAVIDVTPPDARVTVDGQPLEGSASPRTREGLIAGDHVLLVEAPGYVAHRQVFTLQEADRRVVVSLDREPPEPLPQQEEPAAEPPPPASEPVAAQPAAAEPEPPPLEDLSKLSKKELAKRRRAERVAERYRARRAAAAESGGSSKKHGASGSSSSAAASGSTGLLKLNSTPWSEVYVDKKHVGHTPLLGLVLPAGKHVVELKNPQTGAKKKLRIKLKAGETLVKIEKLR